MDPLFDAKCFSDCAVVHSIFFAVVFVLSVGLAMCGKKEHNLFDLLSVVLSCPFLGWKHLVATFDVFSDLDRSF